MRILTVTATRGVAQAQSWLPIRFVTVADSKEGHAHRVPADALSAWAFWTPNTALFTWVIVADIDHGDGDFRAWGCPVKPSYVIHTSGGRVQAGWIIEGVSHGPLARPHPQRYLQAVTNAIRSSVGCDPEFTGDRCRNPVYDVAAAGGQVRWGHVEPRSLKALHRALRRGKAWCTAPPTPAAGAAIAARPPIGGFWGPWPEVIPVGERNCTLFHLARRAPRPAAAVHALAARCTEPLPANEVDRLARQAEKYSRRPGSGRVPEAARRGPEWARYVMQQTDLGRRGGQRRTDPQKAALAQGPAAAAIIRTAEATVRAAAIWADAQVHLAAGLSLRAAAAAVGVSPRTLRRYRDLGGASLEPIRYQARGAGSEPTPQSPAEPTEPAPKTAAAGEAQVSPRASDLRTDLDVAKPGFGAPGGRRTLLVSCTYRKMHRAILRSTEGPPACNPWVTGDSAESPPGWPPQESAEDP